MSIWKTFKEYFKLACDMLPGESWIFLVVLVFIYAVIMTIIAIAVSKKRKDERRVNDEYCVKTQSIIEKQHSEIVDLKNDKKRREYRDSLFEEINNNEDEHEE